MGPRGVRLLPGRSRRQRGPGVQSTTTRLSGALRRRKTTPTSPLTEGRAGRRSVTSRQDTRAVSVERRVASAGTPSPKTSQKSARTPTHPNPAPSSSTSPGGPRRHSVPSGELSPISCLSVWTEPSHRGCGSGCSRRTGPNKRVRDGGGPCGATRVRVLRVVAPVCR